jgi:hypothetical protein
MKDVYRTKTGIEIGCMYEKPLPQPTRDEEMIQRVLLGIPLPNRTGMCLYVVLLTLMFAGLAMGFRGVR